MACSLLHCVFHEHKINNYPRLPSQFLLFTFLYFIPLLPAENSTTHHWATNIRIKVLSPHSSLNQQIKVNHVAAATQGVLFLSYLSCNVLKGVGGSWITHQTLFLRFLPISQTNQYIYHMFVILQMHRMEQYHNFSTLF